MSITEFMISVVIFLSGFVGGLRIGLTQGYINCKKDELKTFKHYPNASDKEEGDE